MKELQRLTGGYKRHIDYLLTLQSEVLGVQNSLFRALGHDLVLSGCEITDHENGTVSIATGVVYVSGQIVRFPGASNVDVGKAIVLNPVPVQSDPDEFFDGSIKNTYKENFATIADATNTATQIIVNTTELYNIKQYMHDIVQSYGQKGEIKDVYDFDNTFLSNFDSSGLGTTPKWAGWALMNGNNGTPNATGRVRMPAGRMTNGGVEYNYSHGGMGGSAEVKLSVGQLPKHRVRLFTNQTGNAATSSDLVSGAGVMKATTTSGTRDEKYVLLRGSIEPTLGMSSEVGSDLSHENRQPYIVVYTVIKIT